MRGTRRLVRVLALFLGVALGGSTATSAATQCTPAVTRRLAYGLVFYGSHLPRVLAGYLPNDVQAWVACSNNPYHVNFGGLAVAQTQVLGKPLDYYDKCSALGVRVLNGQFQWGLMGIAAGGSGSVPQSTVAGSVLAIELTMVSQYGVNVVNTFSWTGDPSCPVW